MHSSTLRPPIAVVPPAMKRVRLRGRQSRAPVDPPPDGGIDAPEPPLSGSYRFASPPAEPHPVPAHAWPWVLSMICANGLGVLPGDIDARGVVPGFDSDCSRSADRVTPCTPRRHGGAR